LVPVDQEALVPLRKVAPLEQMVEQAEVQYLRERIQPPGVLVVVVVAVILEAPVVLTVVVHQPDSTQMHLSSE
jgi:hypothetical protein